MSNLLTEADAGERWCPYTPRPKGNPSDGVMRASSPSLRETRCIASRCMAWRRAETPEFKATAEAEFRTRGGRMVSDTGYCGLAGRPE